MSEIVNICSDCPSRSRCAHFGCRVFNSGARAHIEYLERRDAEDTKLMDELEELFPEPKP